MSLYTKKPGTIGLFLARELIDLFLEDLKE